MISSDWTTIIASATDISTVCEIYPFDAVPGDDGFDPNDALACYAAIDEITYMGVEYTRLVSSFGSIKRSIGKESNTASVTFSNVNRTISRFEFNNGFEGLIMVIRTISRSQSDSLEKSQILFAGRCDKPSSGTKDDLTVNATWVLGGPAVQIPRRKYTDYDQEGRPASDPEFEGFLFMPQYGTIAYSTREKRGGFLGLLGFKKTVKHTLQYSSHSDLDANKCLPEVFGVVQLLGSHIAYEDVGVELRMFTAFAEGDDDGIYDITNYRTVQSLFGILTDASVTKGLIGAANHGGWTTPWPGDPDGTSNYSRTAALVSHTTPDSSISEDDPAPDIAALVWGKLVTIPDPTDWTNTGQFSVNGVAHERWLLTSKYVFALDESWLEDSDNTESYNYCDELILLKSASDFLLLVQG